MVLNVNHIKNNAKNIAININKQKNTLYNMNYLTPKFNNINHFIPSYKHNIEHFNGSTIEHFNNGVIEHLNYNSNNNGGSNNGGGSNNVGVKMAIGVKMSSGVNAPMGKTDKILRIYKNKVKNIINDLGGTEKKIMSKVNSCTNNLITKAFNLQKYIKKLDNDNKEIGNEDGMKLIKNDKELIRIFDNFYNTLLNLTYEQIKCIHSTIKIGESECLELKNVIDVIKPEYLEFADHIFDHFLIKIPKLLHTLLNLIEGLIANSCNDPKITTYAKYIKNKIQKYLNAFSNLNDVNDNVTFKNIISKIKEYNPDTTAKSSEDIINHLNTVYTLLKMNKIKDKLHDDTKTKILKKIYEHDTTIQNKTYDGIIEYIDKIHDKLELTNKNKEYLEDIISEIKRNEEDSDVKTADDIVKHVRQIHKILHDSETDIKYNKDILNKIKIIITEYNNAAEIKTFDDVVKYIKNLHSTVDGLDKTTLLEELLDKIKKYNIEPLMKVQNKPDLIKYVDHVHAEFAKQKQILMGAGGAIGFLILVIFYLYSKNK
jgi:hypothetical protein